MQTGNSAKARLDTLSEMHKPAAVCTRSVAGCGECESREASAFLALYTITQMLCICHESE